MKIRLKKSSCEKLIKAIDDYIRKVDDELKKALEEAGYADPKLTMKEIEKLEREMKKLLDADTKAIINEIYDYDTVEDFIVSRWPDVKNSKDLVEKLTSTVSLRLQEAIPDFVEEYISRTDPALRYIGLTHETTAWIQSWSADLANLMKLTDNNAIERILAGAVKNGLSVADTAKKIADSGIRDSGYRARRTATTELLRAHSVAQQESFMQSPAVVSKMWRHSGWRQYARENHMDMDGQTVRKEEPFVLFSEDGGVYYPMYPRDQVLPAGESINCGCIAEPIVDESFYEMSEEDRQRMQQAEINRLDEEYRRSHPNTIAVSDDGGIIETDKEVADAFASGDIKDSLNVQKQARHIKGTDGYVEGKSYLYGTQTDAKALYNTYKGTGTPVYSRDGNWTHKERISANKEIGVYIDPATGNETPTSNAMIHYSKTGSHIIPRKEDEK